METEEGTAAEKEEEETVADPVKTPVVQWGGTRKKALSERGKLVDMDDEPERFELSVVERDGKRFVRTEFPGQPERAYETIALDAEVYFYEKWREAEEDLETALEVIGDMKAATERKAGE